MTNIPEIIFAEIIEATKHHKPDTSIYHNTPPSLKITLSTQHPTKRPTITIITITIYNTHVNVGTHQTPPLNSYASAIKNTHYDLNNPNSLATLTHDINQTLHEHKTR